MKMRANVMLFLLVVLAMTTGCAGTGNIKPIAGDISQPHESLGTVEVKAKTCHVLSNVFWWWPARILTLGHVSPPSRAERYRKALDKKLAQRAHKYHADAVIKVRYWPALDSASFPERRVYARGEMVRYIGFPEESEPVHEETSSVESSSPATATHASVAG